MPKDFNTWNRKKQQIEISQKKHLFKDGDIWWISIGINVGQESCGKGTNFRRPVLVIQKLSDKNFIGIPLSTKEKTGTWFSEIYVHGEKRFALLYQIRMFSSNRFQRRLATVTELELSQVKEKLKSLLKL